MGFFKSIFRGVSKVFSGAAKVVKKVVKGVSTFVKSPGGMMMLTLLGGAFVAGGGLSSLFGGLSQGTSSFGTFMSKLGTNIGRTFGKGFSGIMKQGFGKITSPIKGLFGGLKTSGTTILGPGFETGVTHFTKAGLQSALAQPGAHIGGTYLSTSAANVGAKSFASMAKKGLQYKGAASMMQQPQQIAEIKPITLEQPGWGRPVAAGEQIGFNTIKQPGDTKFSDNLVAYVQDAYGAANPVNSFNLDLNSYNAFDIPGGSNLYVSPFTPV